MAQAKIKTADLAASVVTKAKIENVTPGNVLGQNGTSAAAPVEIGVPIVITSGTVSSVATLSIDLTNYYTVYDEFELHIISARPATDATFLWCRLSTDGTTYITTGYRWGFIYLIGATQASIDDSSPSATTAIQMTGSSSSTTARPINGILKLYNPGSSTFFPMIDFHTHRYSDTPNLGTAIGTGMITTAQVTKGIRLMFSSGNISTLTYKLIGYKNS